MFKIKKSEETVNRTLRFPETLLNKMYEIAQKEGISFNNLVVQCCEYALDHISENNKT